MTRFSQIGFCLCLSIFVTDGRIVPRCELLQSLYDHYEDIDRYGDWLCLAEHASGYDSSLRVASSAENTFGLGLFRVYNEFWCRDEHFNRNGCGVDCSALHDDNIDDDVACALIINQDHDFKAWGLRWGKNCRGRDLQNYTEGCHPRADSENKPAHILKQTSDIKFILGKEYQYIICEATGKPKPTLKWEYDKKEFPDAYERQISTGLKLLFPVSPNRDINVRCHAQNFFSRDDAIFYVKYEDGRGFPFVVVCPIVLIHIIGIVALSLYFCHKYYYKRGLQSDTNDVAYTNARKL